MELERCVQNHDLLADLFIRHVGVTSSCCDRLKDAVIEQEEKKTQINEFMDSDTFDISV